MTVMVVISRHGGYNTAVHAALIEATPTTLEQNILPNTRLMNTNDGDYTEKTTISWPASDSCVELKSARFRCGEASPPPCGSDSVRFLLAGDATSHRRGTDTGSP